jgi:uncharacterized coiled-coil protein SlyX
MNLFQGSALILTGISIGAALWKNRSSTNSAADPREALVEDLETRLAVLETVRNSHTDAEDIAGRAQTVAAIATLESTVAALTTRYDNRLAAAESRLSDHDAKLKELPTLAQVVSTMEEMLSSTMSDLDSKLFEQVRTIEILRTTVAQSDELMGKVLDSIDRLQHHRGESAAA